MTPFASSRGYAGFFFILSVVTALSLMGCPTEPTVKTAASFTATPINGTLPLDVAFKDTSTPASAAITAWAWNFGDGATSTAQNPDHTYANAGMYTVALKVTTSVDSDTETRANYVIVGKATPNVTAWPTASDIGYGQTLGSSILHGGTASVEGTYTFNTPDIIPPGVGTYVVAVTFTPANTANYYTVSGTLNVAVNKITPDVTVWPTASIITYEQTLASSTLTGGAASVPGTFAFTTPATVPKAGTHPADVTFTPANTTNCRKVLGSIPVTVNKAAPKVTTWPVASAITYGQTLASSTLTGGETSVLGTFAFTAPATAPNIGTYTAAVRFTPEEADNYIPVSGTVSVTVGKATPTVTTWPTASGINYGQTLLSSTLTGGAASVTGTFAFTEPATAPNAGTYTAAVTFTPTNTTNYNKVSGSVPVIVAKITPSVFVWPTAAAIVYEQTLAASALTGGEASVAGAFAFTAPATVPNVGIYTAAVTFTPANTMNYTTVSGSVSVTINKATPSVSKWPTASAITFGQTLADSTLSGGTTSVPGTFSFDAPATAPGIGTYTADVTFTPAVTANYYTVSGKVAVTINKITPSITAWPTASAIDYGQTLASSTLTGGTADVAGSFAFAAPATAPNAGTYDALVIFTPANTANYATVSATVPVTVNKLTPTVTAWPTASAVIYEQTLASSTFTGGEASVAGTFAFTAPATVPDLGTYTAAVTFTPTDSTNYNTVPGSVSVIVRIVYFVKQGASGDGSSWNSAFGTIQQAVDAAFTAGGGEIWVAAGVYAATTDPVVTMKSTVHIYGGFAGTETSLEARDWAANTTAIDGAGLRRCVIGASNATIDGFTIQNGYTAETGGGMYNYTVSPTVNNCTFTQNKAYDGGGMDNEEAAPTLTNCTFDGNEATGGSGGGMNNLNCLMMVTDCTFSDNTAKMGGGGMNNTSSSLTVTNCTFAKNAGLFLGGGMRNDLSSPTVTNCEFTENISAMGGGMYTSGGAPKITNCTFSKNTIPNDYGSGAGMCNDAASANITDCTFTENAATGKNNKGAGMYNNACSPLVTSCDFTGNKASGVSSDGGGMYNNNALPILTNCIFSENAATNGGALSNNTTSSIKMMNCTIVKNTATASGGGIYNDGGSSPTVTNCILWADSAATNNEIHNTGSSSNPVVSYSCIKDSYTGAYNISVNPVFVSAATGNYRLKSTSPCIDKGTSEGAPDTDIENVERPQGAGYDMGAYEFTD